MRCFFGGKCMDWSRKVGNFGWWDIWNSGLDFAILENDGAGKSGG